MSETKWTPGPWEAVNVERHGHRFMFVRAPNCVVENTRGPSYAQEILSDEDYPTKAADLDLVASAPTMYAELESTDEKLTKLIYDLENRVDAKSIALLVSWQNDVRAALARARGETP